jgi:hypothetical protein
LAQSLQKIQEHLQTGTIVDLHWVWRSANGLADRITNEGIDEEGPELDTIWSNIPNGQFRTNCIQLATKDCDDNQSTNDHIEDGGTKITEGHVGSRQNPIAHHSNMSYNVDPVTQQEEVQHHSPVNKKKYRGCLWESRKDNQQATKDEGQKGFPWSSMDTPHPSTDMGSGNDCRTACRAKDYRRDDGRAPKNTHSETVKKDEKVHLYERRMIARTSP